MAVLSDSLEGNIRHVLTKKPLPLPVEIYEIFLLIHFSGPVNVIALSSIDGGFLLTLLFKVVWKVKILIISLFSL